MASRKQKNITLYDNISHQKQIEDCFNTDSQEFINMMEIIKTSDPDKFPLHKHHIVPRSYFNKTKQEIDNSNNNIAYVTPYEHCLIHYYAWKCSKPVIKRSMARAWHFMVNTCNKGIKNINLVAEEYSRAVTEMLYSVDDVNKRLRSLKSSFKCVSADHKLKFICNKCGYTKFVSRNWHKSESECPFCKKLNAHPYNGKYPLVFAIGVDNKAYKFTTEPCSDNKSGKYSWESLYAHAKHSIGQRHNIKKWSLIGSSDIEIKCNMPLQPSYSREMVDLWSGLYKFSNKLTRYFFPRITLANINNARRNYGLEELPKLYKSCESPKYYIEEFDIGAKTIEQWQECLGLCWTTIKRRYTVKEEDVIEIFKYMIDIYKRTKSLDFLDVLKEEILTMYKYSED